MELRCALSTPLVAQVKRGEVDIALVTRMNDFTGGRVVHREQLVWISAAGSEAHRESPLPLALLPAGNILRDHAIDVLERAGRNWRIACISESASGLLAAVHADMAVTVLGRSSLAPGLRELHADELPPLPAVELLLLKKPGEASTGAAALHDCLTRYLSAGPAPLAKAQDATKPRAKAKPSNARAWTDRRAHHPPTPPPAAGSRPE